jgi:hypothetical protein
VGTHERKHRERTQLIQLNRRRFDHRPGWGRSLLKIILERINLLRISLEQIGLPRISRRTSARSNAGPVAVDLRDAASLARLPNLRLVGRG